MYMEMTEKEGGMDELALHNDKVNDAKEDFRVERDEGGHDEGLNKASKEMRLRRRIR